MVAQQTTEFAPGPLFGYQFKAAVAGMAVGTGDVGFLHRINMRQWQNRSSPVPLPPLANDLGQRSVTEPQLLRTERVYSPFAKTFLASHDEDFATGSHVGGWRLKKRLRTNQLVMPKDRTFKKH
jgi:hypothetical protein